MAEDTQEPAEQLVVDDAGVLKVVAGSLRMRIVELLRQRAATVKDLAAALQTSPKSLYYHVNLLEKHSLIRVVDTRIVSGIIEKRYRASAYVFLFPGLTAPAGGDARRHLQDDVADLLSITGEEIRHEIAQGRIDAGAGSDKGERSLRFAWTLLRLLPEEAAALADRMEALLSEYEDDSSRPAERDRGTYRLFQVLFPTYRRGAPADPDAFGAGR